MEIEVLTQIITTVGFPCAVTMYLLYERTKQTTSLIDVINENTAMTRELAVYIKELVK